MYSYINRHLGLLIAIPAIALSLLLVNSANAQTTTDTTSTTTTTTGDTTGATPGAPNTGAGGNAAMNELILLASAGIAVGGIVYLYRSSKEEQNA
jgi:hypothetical protein